MLGPHLLLWPPPLLRSLDLFDPFFLEVVLVTAPPPAAAAPQRHSLCRLGLCGSAQGWGGELASDLGPPCLPV